MNKQAKSDVPELPEVETTLRGLLPHLQGQQIAKIIVREPRLRWPIPASLEKNTKKQIITDIRRRGKYLLMTVGTGTVILHLGMSGRLRILKKPTPPQKHDHLDICLTNGDCLRLTDPRRFGAVLWTEQPEQHPLLANMGPEPLTDQFDGEYLKKRAGKRKVSVKAFIMDNKMVVGVGNIYATEALYQARIHPLKAAGEVTLQQYRLLAAAIKDVLLWAIEKGGTTLRDFAQSDGKPGYFQIELRAYGREGEACGRCAGMLEKIVIGQRSTVFCGECQR